jgi:hypothetical protein
MSSLLIKISPTGDPEAFKYSFSRYLTMLSGLYPVRFVIAINREDCSMNQPSVRTWIETRARNARIELHSGNFKNPVEAVNAALEYKNNEIVVIASEEIIPAKMSYDHQIISVYSQAFPNFDGAVKFYDGIRPKEDPVMAAPVIGCNLLAKLGKVYCPSYEESLYREDLSMACIHRAAIVRSDLGVFEPSEWRARFSAAEPQQPSPTDLAVFTRRQAEQFPIPFS